MIDFPAHSTPAKKVLMLVNSYARDDWRVMAEAGALVRAGYEVHLIGVARHSKGGVRVREVINGIYITLVPMHTSTSLKALGRAFWRWLRGDIGEITLDQPHRHTNLVSLMFFNLWCLRLGLGMEADVVHAHDLSPLPAAWLIAHLRRMRLVYDAHESAPDFYLGRKGKMAGWLEKALIGKPQVVITVGERLARALQDRGAKRVVVIGNWKPLKNYQLEDWQIEQERQRFGLTNYQLVIAYFGLLHPERDIEPLLQSVTACPEVTLLISGEGVLKERVMEAATTTSNIRWLGWLKIDEIGFYTALADVVYYSINPDQSPQANYSTPNKLFEAFAAGKAMIARRGVGEIGEILELTGAGLLLDEITPESLQAAFQKLQEPEILKYLQDCSKAARKVYSWGKAEERLLALYRELFND
ncbi:MAG: glycosyltransferase [Chloroflexi bacterium]|nr:glycosyltransferase [Chloroflexota bacterium]